VVGRSKINILAPILMVLLALVCLGGAQQLRSDAFRSKWWTYDKNHWAYSSYCAEMFAPNCFFLLSIAIVFVIVSKVFG